MERAALWHRCRAPYAYPVGDGHLREVLLASNVSAAISASKVPLLEGALDCIRAGYIPGGLNNNRAFAECLVEHDPQVAEDLRTILYDPQTAGGLLAGLPAEELERRGSTRCHLPHPSLTGRYNKTFCLHRSILRLRFKTG